MSQYFASLHTYFHLQSLFRRRVKFLNYLSCTIYFILFSRQSTGQNPVQSQSLGSSVTPSVIATGVSLDTSGGGGERAGASVIGATDDQSTGGVSGGDDGGQGQGQSRGAQSVHGQCDTPSISLNSLKRKSDDISEGLEGNIGSDSAGP